MITALTCPLSGFKGGRKTGFNSWVGGGGLPVIKYLASILLRNTCQDTSPADDVVKGTDHRAQKPTDLCTGTVLYYTESRNYLDILLELFLGSRQT